MCININKSRPEFLIFVYCIRILNMRKATSISISKKNIKEKYVLKSKIKCYSKQIIVILYTFEKIIEKVVN